MTKYLSEEIENKVTQLRKGILELAILSALNRVSHYGYSLVRELTAAGAAEMKEGTIYPILSRLAKEELVRTEWVESSQGPPRKYYSLTDSGRAMGEALNLEFRRLVGLIDAANRPASSGGDVSEKKTLTIGRKDHD